MSAMRGQMDVIKSVWTPMAPTHVLAELATDLLQMDTPALVYSNQLFTMVIIYDMPSLFQTLMSAVRGLIGVTRTAIMLMVLMHVAVTVAIVLMEMDLPAMVVLWFQYTGAF